MFRFGEVTGFLLGTPSPPPVRPRRRASAVAIRPAGPTPTLSRSFKTNSRAADRSALSKIPSSSLSNFGINSTRCPRREPPRPRRPPRPPSAGGPAAGRPLRSGGPFRRNDSRAASRSSSSSSPSLFLSNSSRACLRSASRSGRSPRPVRSAGCAVRLAADAAIKPPVRSN